MDKKLLYLYVLLKLVVNKEYPTTRIRHLVNLFNSIYEIESRIDYATLYIEVKENLS